MTRGNGTFGGLTYGTAETLVLNTQNGANLITVNGTPGTALTVNAGVGSDTLLLQGGQYRGQTFTATGPTSGTISRTRTAPFQPLGMLGGDERNGSPRNTGPSVEGEHRGWSANSSP